MVFIGVFEKKRINHAKEQREMTKTFAYKGKKFAVKQPRDAKHVSLFAIRPNHKGKEVLREPEQKQLSGGELYRRGVSMAAKYTS